jgi:AcrR family transcriptional regulator
MSPKTIRRPKTSSKTHNGPVKKVDQYHHGDLRGACLKGALSFIERGHIDFSLRDLARKIGVSHQAPYHHFKTQAALLAALAQEGHHEFANRLERARSQAKGPVLPEMGLAYTRFAYEKPHHYRLMFLDGRVCIEDFAELKAQAERSFNELLKGVEHDFADQKLSAQQVLTKAASIWSFTHGLSCLLLDGRLEMCGLKAPLSAKDFAALSSV